MNCSSQAAGSASGGGGGGGKRKRNRKRTSLKSSDQTEIAASVSVKDNLSSVVSVEESQSCASNRVSNQCALDKASSGAPKSAQCAAALRTNEKKSSCNSENKETLAGTIPHLKVAPAIVQCGLLEAVSSLSIGHDKADCISSPANIKSSDSNCISKTDNLYVNGKSIVDKTSIQMSTVDQSSVLAATAAADKATGAAADKAARTATHKAAAAEKAAGATTDSAAGTVADKAVRAAAHKAAAAEKAAGTTTDKAAEAVAGAPVQKSKAELSRERRAIQEAQRALKGSTAKQGKGPGKENTPQGSAPAASKQQDNKKAKNVDVSSSPAGSLGTKQTADKKVEREKKPDGAATPQLTREVKVRVPDQLQQDNLRMMKKNAKKLEKQNIPNRALEKLRKVGLFQHLCQYERDVPLTRDILLNSTNLHPAVIKLGLQYAEGVICGSNARCIALLQVMKQVIADYSTPPNTELSRDLEARILRPTFSFLTQCRPLSISMGNAIRHLKRLITLTPSDCSDAEAKQNLCAEIDNFLKEKIVLAADAISDFAGSKIHTGDVILVYACSSLIKTVLCSAYLSKKFSVIVVDSRPKEEGREMLRRLVQHGIPCSYVLISSVSYVMKEVTQVLLGAHALLANGYMMSRVGSSQVALIAKAYNVPVIVCCETYKFSEKVWTDSFVANELGDPSDLVRTCNKSSGALSNWISVPRLNLLNLVYDVTPPQLINMVITDITDFGLVPCTSVPVVLRVKSSEIS